LSSDSSQIHFRTCPLCEATCGLEIHTEGDQIVKVRGDDRDVFSGGFVCPKGASLKALHEDPDRLRRPLVKRDGVHVEVDWDEAFAEIEQGLMPIIERWGRDAVAIYLGNPNVHNLAGAFYGRPLIKSLRTRNVYSASTVDQMPKHVSSGLLFGDPNAIPVPDLDRTDFLLMLGANPLESNGSLCTAPDFPGRLKALRLRGGKLVVVDPRRTRTAELADEHHFIRPGSDASLLVAMLHVIFAEGLADLGNVADHVKGVGEVSAAVEGFTPERAAPHCGIEADTIRQLARELAAAGSAAVYGRIGTHTVSFGTLASWAVDALNIVTGNLDRPGGAMFPLPAHGRADKQPGGRGFETGRWKSRVRGFPEVRSELPIATLAEEIQTGGEGQVRALITIAGNPALSAPDAGTLDTAIAGLDFMLSIDLYCNETTRHANVILPPTSPLERSHYDAAFYGISVRNIANYSPPIFETESPSEADIFARLSLLLSGQGSKGDPNVVHAMLLRGLLESHTANPRSPIHGRDLDELQAAVGDRSGPDALLDVLLRLGPYGEGFGRNPDGLSLGRLEANPHGIDLGPLLPRVPELLSTPSASIELAPPSILAELDRLDSILEEHGGQGEGLLLIGRRDVRSNNSWMHNLAPLVRGRDRCTLQMHPADASRLGVEGAERVEIRSHAGKLTAPLELNEGLMPGVVSLPHGWGHDLEGARLDVARSHAGVNSNRLTDAGPLDPLSGNAVLNGIPVEVAAAGAT
jgi:anaerobic selenocysteine-containing dehydrogenase